MDIQQMINDYSSWLKSEISVAQYGQYYELTIPYLDRFNDYLQIYVKQDENGKISITDDGYIIGNLLSGGMSLRANSARKQALDRIIRNYSLQLRGDDITATATAQDFPQKKHMMVQAMLAIDDLYETNADKVKNYFAEDMQTFLDANEIFYSRDFSLVGKTGSLYTYDFHFQRTRQKPERFCRTINRLNESNRNLTIFNWIDTREKRNNEGQMIVMLNDENTVNITDIDAFLTYNIEPVLFSKRQESIELFFA